ncbi:MAG: hypothetical protein ACM3VT_19120, partial [Solirubrobacterales bacterium]
MMIDVDLPIPRRIVIETAIIDMARSLAHAVQTEPSDMPVESFSADAEDVRLAGRGDGEAYRRLIKRHQGQVSKILWRFSRDHRVHEELVPARTRSSGPGPCARRSTAWMRA